MDLAALTATEQKSLLDSKEASCSELLADCRARAILTEPVVNSIPTLHWDAAEELARQLDTDVTFMAAAPLRGLITAFKDLLPTKGVRTTFGSLAYSNFIPEEDHPLVAAIRELGMVPIGKTNTPELGAGSQTFNSVFGVTRNPWDLTRTCGGSSGGAAAALACGSISLADGSDLGGSLRNPASFCGVVGFRPSSGQFPYSTPRSAAIRMPTNGPLARTVRDVLLFYDSLHDPTVNIPRTAKESNRSVAYSRDFGGLPVDPEVLQVLDRAIDVLSDSGWRVVQAEPDLTGADHPFDDLRGLHYWESWSELLNDKRTKTSVQFELRYGQSLNHSLIDKAVAAEDRTRAIWESFMSGADHSQRYDLLLGPVSQVTAFPIGWEFVSQISGATLPHYTDWMRSCSRITVTGAPAISVPVGFTDEGLPVGLQMVGRRGHDRDLLGHALAAEQIFGLMPAPDIAYLAGSRPETLPTGPRT